MMPMLLIKSRWIALIGAAIVSTASAFAQSVDNQALINALIKKGVLSDQEAKDITAQIAKDQASEDVETSGDKYIQKLVISGRFQTQYVGLGTSIDGTAVNPVSTEHFLIRRIYIGATAYFADGFSGVVNYDLANSSFDKAFVEWKQSTAFILDAGFSKAPFGYEELTSSGNLKAIERSPSTRYFDEPNNGRRLGASSYRTGLFLSGSEDGFFYSVALTNPERNEYSGDATNTAVLVNGQGGVGSTGNSVTNKFAYYGTIGYAGSFGSGAMKGSYKAGYETGYLPDQGGPGATIGAGQNIILNGAFADFSIGGFNLQGEYEKAKDDSGIAISHNANPYGYWIMPSYKFTPEWEGVVRYSYVNSDGRGVALSDGIRSAPSGGTMNTMKEWYVGGNWYIKGNDVKLQAGFIHGESDNTVKGGPAKAETDGVRSQVQVNF
jgi:polyhydroxyalkanoate synthesis regulator phasin